MGIIPKDPADFDPTMGNYNDLRPFRFWCQKVLPLVYDDSLSYYEVLCKLVDYLNKTMEDVGVLHDDVDALHVAYQQLQSYVNDYFSTLDVQQEINNKLDIMAEDGTLDALLLPYFNAYKTEINGIVAQQNANITVLQSRMDEFERLPDGSTTSDAELVDIRVGADGLQYPTAGDAVRSQVTSLNDAVEYLGAERKTVEDFTWRNGYYYSSLGAFTESDSARTSSPIHLESGMTIEVWCRMYSDAMCVLIKTQADGTPIEYIYLGNGTLDKYAYKATAECYVIFSYWYANGFKCTIFPNLKDVEDEVADIRKAYDDKVYDSAGNAVRAQMSELHTDLTYMGVTPLGVNDLTWEDGYYVRTLGNLTPSEHAKTSSPIHLKKGMTIELFARMYNDTQCVLVKTDEDGEPIEYIYLGDGNYNKYVYKAPDECYVIFSYWYVNGFKCTLFPNTDSIEAEVEDIRIGTDGVTYPSAGVAVRSQISYLQDQLGIEDKTEDDLTWTSGYYVKTLGPITEYAGTRTSNAIKLNAGDTIDLWSRMYNDTQCVLMLSNSEGVPYEYIYLGDGTYREYVYTAPQDCYVIFTYWYNLGFKCTIIRGTVATKREYVVAKSGGDYSSFTQCLYTLQNDSSEKIIYVQSGEYDIYEELGGDAFIQSIDDPEHTNWADVNPIVPPNTHIIGRGNVTLKFTPTAEQIGSQAMAVLFSPLNIRGNCTIENISIECTNCRYAIHDESGGQAKFNDNVHKYINVRAHKIKGTYGYNPTYAAGVGARSRWYFEDCVFTSDIGICWTVHTTTSVATDMAAINFNNCIFDSDNGTPNTGMVQFLVGGGQHLATKNIVFFAGCCINGGIFVTPNGASGLTNKFALTLVGNKLTNSITIDPTFDSNPYIPKVYMPIS